MKLRLYRAFLAGFVLVVVFTGSVVGLDAALHSLFPQAFDGMATLVFALPELILVTLVGMVLSIGSSFWILRDWSGKSKLYVIGMGGVATIIWFLALSFAFPDTNRYWLIAATALIGAIIFALKAALLSVHVVYRLLFSSLLIVCGVWTMAVQYNDGTQRAQLEALKNAGYVIYIPGDASVHSVKSITPLNEQYDGYKDGVVIELNNGKTMIEQKIGYRPTANCGSPFIMAENPYNTDTSSLGDFSCKLIANNNGVELYLLEKRSYASYYNDYEVSRVYFAMIGSTWIRAGSSLTVHSVMDPETQSTPEQIKAFEDSKDILLDLVPVNDFSPYLIER